MHGDGKTRDSGIRTMAASVWRAARATALVVARPPLLDRRLRAPDLQSHTPGLTWLLAAVFAAFAVLWRLGPYLFDLGPDARFVWNLTPVGALGVFLGVRLRSRWALLLPIAVMLVSDLLLWKPLADRGFHAFSRWTPLIYGSFLVYALLGRLVRRGPSAALAFPAALLGGAQFFLLTNFAVWAGGDGSTYPKTLAGLGECYAMGLPFLKYTLGGDLLFTGLFLGVHALAAVAVGQTRKASQPA
jgi:hypothetical protein